MTTVSCDPTTAISEALDLFLAGLEMDCPKTVGAAPPGPPYCEDHCTCEHHRPYRCTICGGSGKVPRFPEFQEKCPCPRYCVAYEYSDEGDWQLCGKCSANRDIQRHMMGAHGEWCANCQGRNWKPDITETKLWPYIQLVERQGPKFIAYTGLQPLSQVHYAFGATAMEAMKRALALRVSDEQVSP